MKKFLGQQPSFSLYFLWKVSKQILQLQSPSGAWRVFGGGGDRSSACSGVDMVIMVVNMMTDKVVGMVVIKGRVVVVR